MDTRVQTLRKKMSSPKKSKLRESSIAPYLFISPFFVLFALFFLYPLIYSLVLSFSRFRNGQMEFVGLDNYTFLFSDLLFWKSLSNTGLILLIQVPIMLFLAIFVAVLLNSDLLKYRGLFRLAFFLPALIDLVTYSLVFSLIFNERSGLINQALEAMGVGPLAWSSDGFWAKVMIVCAITWRWTGYNSIILLSGLQMISKELYEAASIDGAGKIVTFFRITIPQLKPVLLFCMIMSTIGTLQLFTEPYVLTQGGPNNETMTAIYYLYQTGFQSFNFGLASAGAYIITFIIALLSYLQIRLSNRGEI